VLDLAMIMVWIFFICVYLLLISGGKKKSVPLSLFAFVILENHGFGDQRSPLLK